MAVKNLEEFLTLDELCEWLKIPKSTIYKYLCDDRIPSFKVGRNRLFDPEEIRVWLNRMPGNTMSRSHAAKQEDKSKKKSEPRPGKK